MLLRAGFLDTLHCFWCSNAVRWVEGVLLRMAGRVGYLICSYNVFVHSVGISYIINKIVFYPILFSVTGL